MEKKLLEFISLLRKNGLRISVAESLDALAAAGHVTLSARSTLKDTLRTTLIKDSHDVAAYDELFDMYFSGNQGIFEEESLLSGLFDEGTLPDPLLKKIAAAMDEMAGGFSPLTRYLLSGDHVLMENLLKDMAAMSGIEKMENHLQTGFVSQNIFSRMPWEKAREDLEKLEQRLLQEGLTAKDIQVLRRQMERKRQALRDALREFVGKEFRKQSFGQTMRSKDHWLSERAFSSLSESEIKRMKDTVARLAQRLKNVAVIRQKTAKKGRVDFKRTLRKSLKYGGVPFGLTMKKRREEKPRLVLLCDVSDSVRTVSAFMLQFVFAVQELFSRVRSFVFVADIGEVTQLFKEKDAGAAIEKAYLGGVINIYSHSNYGRALREFHAKFLGAVTRRTTVIIMGDARNNFNDPSEWALREIRERAREVIWLNPEHPSAWGFGDSIMDVYMPMCDVVEEVRNLAQLSAAVNRLVTSHRSPSRPVAGSAAPWGAVRG